MWTCKKCGKPVYFAERIQSLGFDWHSPCLVCSECGKKLHPGQHAEHAAEPYCHHPCYGALFGPRVFGHGTRNECHRAFGKRNKEADADRALLDAKLKEFNAVHEGKPSEIRRREVNGRPVLEGVLRIHWGVECLIHLKQEDPGGGGGGAVVRSGSRSSVTSGPASDDSDEEPLWRDESPPSSTPSTPSPLSAPSTPATPNPNWPPTPYPTLRPSAPHGGGGPQASPVLSYTHNASPSPVVHPLTSVDVVHFPNGNVFPGNGYGNSGDINGLSDNGNNNPRNGNDSSKHGNDSSNNGNKSSENVNEDPRNGNDCSENLCNGASPEGDTRTLVRSQPEPEGGFSCPDSRYATMKTRTVRRSRDPMHTQSMRDSLLVVIPGGGDPQGEEEAQEEDVGAKDNSTVANKDNVTHVSSQENGNDSKENSSNDNKENGSKDNKDSAGESCSKGGRGDGKKGGVVKRVSFSQVDWGEKLRGVERREKEETVSLDSQGETKFFAGEEENKPLRGGEEEEEETKVSKEENGDEKKPPGLEKEDQTTSSPSTEKRPKGKALLRRRPGRRMDKRKVKRRCSINGHLYLRETSSFHLSSDCPPAVVRVSSITTTSHIITTILEKYKIEMSSSNFALCVVKETGERRRLGDTETPLVLRVLMGPHDDVARLVICDAAVSSDVSPEMAEFLHLSLAECRAILRQYELEERQQVRAIRAKYDEVKFYCQYWLEQMGGPGPPGGGA